MRSIKNDTWKRNATAYYTQAEKISSFPEIVQRFYKNRKEYIEIIESKLNKWTFDRLCLTDQAILLLFTSQLLNNRAPIQVCIDMAVDLAHRYCDEKSYRYINKVLDRVGKENA